MYANFMKISIMLIRDRRSEYFPQTTLGTKFAPSVLSPKCQLEAFFPPQLPLVFFLCSYVNKEGVYVTKKRCVWGV
jgi:hypothetical protein